MNRTLAFLRLLGLALFAGGGIACAGIVAPVVFRTLAPDRVAAGAVFGAVLHVFEIAALIALGVSLLASFVLRFRKAGASIAADAVLVLLLAGSLYLKFMLAPALSVARPNGTGEGTEFMKLHKRYEQAFGLELLLALAGLFALTTVGGKSKSEA